MSENAVLSDKGWPIRWGGSEVYRTAAEKNDSFMGAFQRATTAQAWGWGWGDPALDGRTRSMLDLAMLAALGKAPEVRLQVKGALSNGLSVEEIKSVLLHATTYCGIPAGLDAFQAAHDVLKAEGALADPAPKAAE